MTKFAMLTRERVRYWAFVIAFRLFLSVLPIVSAVAIFGWLAIAPNKADWLIASGGILLILVGLFFAGIRLPSFEAPPDIQGLPAGKDSTSRTELNVGVRSDGTPAFSEEGRTDRHSKHSLLGRFWPLFLSLIWCMGVIVMQLVPLKHAEVEYEQAPIHGASWVFLLLPLAAILWMCLKPAGKAMHDRGVAWVYVPLWFVLMAIANTGAIRVGQAFDADGQIPKLHRLDVTGRQEYSARDQFGRKKYQHWYIGTQLNGRPVEFPVDEYVYRHTRVGETIAATEVAGRSGRVYVYVHPHQ